MLSPSLRTYLFAFFFVGWALGLWRLFNCSDSRSLLHVFSLWQFVSVIFFFFVLFSVCKHFSISLSDSGFQHFDYNFGYDLMWCMVFDRRNNAVWESSMCVTDTSATSWRLISGWEVRLARSVSVFRLLAELFGLCTRTHTKANLPVFSPSSLINHGWNHHL